MSQRSQSCSTRTDLSLLQLFGQCIGDIKVGCGHLVYSSFSSHSHDDKIRNIRFSSLLFPHSGSLISPPKVQVDAEERKPTGQICSCPVQSFRKQQKMLIFNSTMQCKNYPAKCSQMSATFYILIGKDVVGAV